MKFDIGEREIKTEQNKQGIVIRISDDDAVLFEYNKATLKKNAYRTLDKVIKIVKTQKEKEILIGGHTDSTGSDDFNLKLSKKRAEAVYKYFIRKGINKSKMETKGHGEKEPIAENITEKGRARNRRVEITILRLNSKEKEKFDYHYYSGMDNYYKEGYGYAIEEWEKALKIDPENEDVKAWINKAEKEKKEKEKRK